jgi:hypothetical protein
LLQRLGLTESRRNARNSIEKIVDGFDIVVKHWLKDEGKNHNISVITDDFSLVYGKDMSESQLSSSSHTASVVFNHGVSKFIKFYENADGESVMPFNFGENAYIVVKCVLEYLIPRETHGSKSSMEIHQQNRIRHLNSDRDTLTMSTRPYIPIKGTNKLRNTILAEAFAQSLKSQTDMAVS